MLLVRVRCRPAASLAWTILAIAAAGCRSEAPEPRVAATPAKAAEPAAPALVVPTLPDGSPEDLLAFVDALLPPPRKPRSREEMLDYIKGVARVSVEAADKVLAQVDEDSKLFATAADIKLESLAALGRFGDATAPDTMAAFATKLAGSPVPALASEGKRKLIVADEQRMFLTDDFSKAPDLIRRMADLLAAEPNSRATATLAMRMAGEFEHSPELADKAIDAIKAFGPLFANSDNEEIRELGGEFEAKLRLLEIPGKPMEITGTLLDGTAFDQKKYAGKVILVDFWATWCGPCIAEIPNMSAAYKKYHDKGFEIVGISLDEDRAEVEKFVADNATPWPILFGGKGWQDPVAQFYGISGIPQLALIGRDGNVITLDVRGEKLGEHLAELFKDPE